MDIIGLLLLLVSAAVSQTFMRKFAGYAKRQLHANWSGAEVAQKMLREHGIDQVKITCTRGHLTDHYNPQTRTVNLSEQVYSGRNAAAAAIAAHECGHAVQHAQGYVFLRFRSAMVPLLSATSHFIPWTILLGVVLINTTLVPLKIGIALYALTALFSLVTLPVEFDASRRALAWMDRQGVVNSQERQMAKDALWWAAMTYVVAALGALIQLMRLWLVLMNKEDKRGSN